MELKGRHTPYTRKVITATMVIAIIAVSICLSKTKHNIDTGNNSPIIRVRSHKDQEVPQVLPTDLIYQTRSAFVIPEYKLIFFTFPKVRRLSYK